MDRNAMENRSFVITSENVDYNSNLKSRSSSTLETSAINHPRMDGSYFMAATDSMGRPLALRFEKGSKIGNTLTVLEDSRTKGRSHSLTSVELKGLAERNRTSSTRSDVGRVSSVSLNDRHTTNDMDHGSVNIPPFMLSAPRAVASDSPSTTYLNTSPDMGSRQPVASDPGYKKARSTNEESSTYLSRVIASNMMKDGLKGGLKSSTVGTTLLESKEEQPRRESGGSERWLPSDSSAEMYKDSDSPHPAKVPRQNEDHVKQAAYSSQVSVFPNKSFDEMSFTPTIGTTTSEGESSGVNKQGSPKPRRVSYLMATSRGTSSLPDQKIWSTAPQGKKSGKSPLFDALSTMLPPVMVHVSSGMELCEDVNEDEGMEVSTNEHEDEVCSIHLS